MVTIIACYRPGIDEDYYFASHIPLVKRLWEPLGLLGVEIRHIVSSLTDVPSPYQLMASFHFASRDVLERALQHPSSAELMADVPRFVKAPPDILVAESID